jgi:threonine 3-dehydrogenase
MGADVVFNINEEGLDPAAGILDDTGGIGVDVALELAGSPVSIQQAFDVVRKGGRVSAFGITAKPIELDINYAIILRQVRVHGVAGRHMWDTWIQMDGLLQSGQLDPMPVVTHQLPLADYEKGFEAVMSADRKAGKVVLLPWA